MKRGVTRGVKRGVKRGIKPVLMLLATVATLPALGACARAAEPRPELTPASVAAMDNAGAMIDRLPVVTSVIDSQVVTMLLDTGASVTCLQPAASRRIGRAPTGVTRLGGLGDTTHAVSTYGPVTLLLGRFTTAVQSLHGCPALTLLGASGRAIDGVLGADALRGLTVVIDYPENAVRVLPVWSPVADDSASALPIIFLRGLPTITVELRSRGRWEAVSLLLDTGADASLLLDARTAAALDLESDPYNLPIERRGLGGIIATRPFYVSRARLGTLDVRDLPIEVADAGMSQLFDHGIQGIVGGEFLRHFRLEIDLGSARMSIDAPGPERTVCGSRSGICVAPRPDRGGYVIQAVRTRSVADRYSIVAGETIRFVGAAATERMGAAEMRAALAPANGLLSLWIVNSFGRGRRVDFRVVQ